MSQTTGSFPALYDGVKKKPKITPLPLPKLAAPPKKKR